MPSKTHYFAVALCSLSGLLAAPVIAQEEADPDQQFYLGLGIQVISLDFDASLTSAGGTARNGSFESKPGAVNLRGGWYVLPWLPIELQYGSGVDNDEVENGGERFGEAELDTYTAAFLRPEYKVHDNLALVGIAGWNQLKIEGTDGSGTDFDIDESGFAWGLGFQLDSGNARLSLEYMNYVDESGVEADGYILSVQGHF